MHSAKQQVLALLHDYQTAVYHAVALLNAKSAQAPGFQRHQESPGVWAGYLDEAQQVRYTFHGIGCRVTTPAFTVDFDFAQEGGCTGIDTGFLMDYLTRNATVQAKYPLLRNEEQVDQLLQELVHDGLLARHVYSADDRRYYVRADLPNPAPPTVTLHLPADDAC